MQNDDIALDFLNSLEYSEASLLLWGVVDSFFPRMNFGVS